MKQIIVLAAAAFGLSAFAYDADTLGFYSFKGGDPGVFSETVANDVPEGVMNAAVVTAGNGGQTAISDERPGKYVYAGGSFVKSNVLCENPLSLRLGKGKYGDTNKSGVLSFKDAGPNLSKCHAGSGYTYEFFFKMDEGDSSQAWGYQIAADLGYRVVADNAYCPIRIMVPHPDGNYCFRAACTGYDADPYRGTTVDVRKKVDGFSSFMDGRWHHFAQTETVANGVPTIKYYIDYALVWSQQFAASKIVAEETSTGSPYGNSLTVGKYVQLGHQNAWNAAISCVRFTKRALATSELLRASDTEGYDDDVVAFYPFKDGAPSSSAVGTGTLHNEVAPDLFSGTVELKADGMNPSATFDAEGPNRYVYVGRRSRDQKPFAVDPGSVRVTSESTGKSAQMTFAKLGAEISKCHASGSTVEFFVKFLDGNVSSWDPFIRYEPGYMVETVERDFRIYLPYADTDTYRDSLWYSLSSADTKPLRRYTNNSLTPNPLTDGRWHHLAIVETPAAEGAATVSVWYDYKKYGSVAVDSTKETSDRSLELCRFLNHAKYSCLKVTSRPLDAGEFLRAYANLPGGCLLIVR